MRYDIGGNRNAFLTIYYQIMIYTIVGFRQEARYGKDKED